MGKQIMIGQRANVGDYIRNDKLKQQWEACICFACWGSGLEDGKRFHILFECSECEGTKLMWKEVQYMDTGNDYSYWSSSFRGFNFGNVLCSN